MAGRGRKFAFHGAFAKKEDAMKKEREVNGFIREHTRNGKPRYYVFTATERK